MTKPKWDDDDYHDIRPPQFLTECQVCGSKRITCSNIFGAACDPSHLWFRSPGEMMSEAYAALLEHRKAKA